MSNGDQLIIAANQMQELVKGDLVKNLRNANEAKVRLLIIDEVLRILGWQKYEYEPELVTPTGHYTDYRLSIENRPRLIVEAKRIGVIEPFPKAIQRPEYTNSYLYNRCGNEMQSLLKQCLGYCAQLGVPYALATTGEVWIVLLGFKYGTEWDKLKAFVFHSLEDVLHRFNDFYGLVSREAVKNNSLEEKFTGMVLVKPNIAIRPREQLDQSSDLGQPPHKQIIRAYFDQFMGDITRPEQKNMLDQCYVDNRELSEFTRELRQILQYDAALDESDISIDELDESSLEKEMQLQTAGSNPKTILLVGNVGVGKSTFIHRFSRSDIQPKRTICTIIDLINRSTKEIERDGAEEQRLAELILDRLAAEFRENADPYSPEMQRGCFEVELNRFRRQRQNLLKLDPQRYAIEEEEFIYEQSKDKYKHLVGYLKFVRKKRYRIWVAFDNVDRGSDSYQAFIYSFAHQLSSDARCITLITLREDTFLEAQEAGFLDVRSSDIIFQITVPEFRQVISKRRKYIERAINSNEIPKVFRPYTDLISVLNWHITRLVLADNDFVRLLITTFSLNNIRYGFQMLRDYYTSYHSTFHEFYQNHLSMIDIDDTVKLDYEQEANHLLQALMLGNSWDYQEDKSEIFNVFWASRLEKTSHFLVLRLLAYLIVERDTTSARISVKYEKVCNDFISLGYQRDHVNNAIRKMLYSGLIVSPNLPNNPVPEAKMDVPDTLPGDMKIAISGRGHFYLRKLASHQYYQTRVGEDTIWYDQTGVDQYIKCLRESAKEQRPGSDDVLQATEAREIFLNYLKKALLEESVISSIRFTTADWPRLVNDIVERCVFGQTVTWANYLSEDEVLLMLKEALTDALNSINKVIPATNDEKQDR